MARDPLSSDYSNYALRIQQQQRDYAQYRTRLEEERQLKEKRQNVIEVQAQRVDIEKTRSERVAQDAIAAQSDDVSLAKSRTQSSSTLSEESVNEAFMYERPLDSDEVSLKNSPVPRGMIVDLIV